jgi:HPr kinase/phosphorylase
MINGPFTVNDLAQESMELGTDFKIIWASQEALDRPLTTRDISRPGLALTGFIEAFPFHKVQLFGRSELAYLDYIAETNNHEQVKQFFRHPVPCCFICGHIELPSFFLNLCKENQIAVFHTSQNTGPFIRDLSKVLERCFCPSEQIHGVLVEVFGLGVLILGDSGVGKSEAALELIERGHLLISDDSVLLRQTNYNTIEGSSPPLTSNIMEIRGVGLIDVQNLYGIRAIREKKKIEFIVKLEYWDIENARNDNEEERTGLVQHTTRLLGIELPSLAIKVKPGRNIPILIETAAMNHRSKLLGMDTAKLLEERQLRFLQEK